MDEDKFKLKPKSKRTSAPKTRSGCLTCKTRRVKCDEARPQCANCAKLSRTCLWKQTAPKVERMILPQSASQLTQVQPSQQDLKFVDEREAYYFWAYKEETALELSGARRSTAWSHIMLQACHTDPFVLRALVAIGALNKSHKMSHAASMDPSIREVNQTIANQHKQFALAAYDKSIEGMRQIVPSTDKTTSLRKGLLACLLVNCMESFLQDLNTAYWQAQAGYDLLHEWMAESGQEETGLGSSNSSIIEDDIFNEFARQDLYGAIWWGDRQLHRSQRRRREGESTVRDMPSGFSSLEEARKYEELILRRTFHLMNEAMARIIAAKIESGHAATADSPGELVDPCHVPRMLLEDRDRYLHDIRRWCASFQHLLKHSVASPDIASSMGAALLRIHALDAEISLAAVFFTEETSFDRYLPQYQEIIVLCRLVVRKTKQKSAKLEPVFNLTMGIEKALNTVVFTCRDKALRHEALHVLRSQAYLDPTKYICRMAIRAAYLVGLEEQERRADGSIPESARYRMIWSLNHWFQRSRDITIVYARRLGYPLGKAYPAKREWKQITFKEAEVEAMIAAEDHKVLRDRPEVVVEQDDLPDAWGAQTVFTRQVNPLVWPTAVRKPNCLRWAELHEELLQRVPEHPPD